MDGCNCECKCKRMHRTNIIIIIILAGVMGEWQNKDVCLCAHLRLFKFISEIRFAYPVRNSQFIVHTVNSRTDRPHALRANSHTHTQTIIRFHRWQQAPYTMANGIAPLMISSLYLSSTHSFTGSAFSIAGHCCYCCRYRSRRTMLPTDRLPQPLKMLLSASVNIHCLV